MATAAISWLADVEQALARAGAENKLALLEFSQAPRCAGCVRLEGQVYPNEQVNAFLFDHFVPVRLLRSDHPQEVKRFNIMWTPTILMLEPDGTERHRMVGYVTLEDFIPQLELGLAKAAFGREDFAGAQKAFEGIFRLYPSSEAAPEALYWAGVSAYKPNRDRAMLKQAAERLQQHFPHSEWTKKSSVWLG